jgi:hypothetical protein
MQEQALAGALSIREPADKRAERPRIGPKILGRSMAGPYLERVSDDKRSRMGWL